MRNLSDGFSVVKTLIIVLFSIIILGLGSYFVITSINSTREGGAVAQAVSVIGLIEEQNIQSSYDKLHPDLKSDSNTYIAWQIWVSEFQRGNIEIVTSSPQASQHKLFQLSDEIALLFDTSGEYKLRLVMSLVDGKWLIKDYSVSK